MLRIKALMASGAQGQWSPSFRQHKCINPSLPTDVSFLDAVKAMGVPYVGDFNDPLQPASSITKLRTAVAADGKRCSAFEAFLPEKFVKRQSNIKICFGVVAQRLDISKNGSERVQGLFLENEKSSGKTFYVKTKEVILCGGAVASPQLLLLRYSNMFSL
jgi:choline dehydrogenase-like flavoprotein